MKSPPLWVVMSLLAGLPQPAILAAAQPFAIDVSVRADAQQQQQSRRCSLPTPASRPVLTTKTRTKLRVRWAVLYQEKSGRLADITVHAFIEKETALRQTNPPKPGPDVVYESALVMDFGPQGKSTADFVVEAPEPGNYLLRVETIGDAKTPRDECFAAIDLKVTP